MMCEPVPLEDVIEQYLEGCRRLEERIARLNRQIALPGGEYPVKELLDRRCLLYTELGEMSSAVREMREYLGAHGKTKSRTPHIT